MRGTVLDYGIQENTGYVSGDDGQRYTFSGADWKSPGAPQKGQKVDFTAVDSKASCVFAIPSAGSSGNGGTGKSRVVAAVLAFFLGHWGVHKFYLGYTKEGVVMLLCGTLGVALFLIPFIVVRIISFVECFVYLAKSNEEFAEVHSTNSKGWF
jgi:TM2 domain-containing membrane protein YozV